ncbi:MAG: hypothetical protein JXA94_03855 [Parachlamydiales bacterium]|nr:hypothetical protein [Parachlamydiales bacterium]
MSSTSPLSVVRERFVTEAEQRESYGPYDPTLGSRSFGEVFLPGSVPDNADGAGANESDIEADPLCQGSEVEIEQIFSLKNLLSRHRMIEQELLNLRIENRKLEILCQSADNDLKRIAFQYYKADQKKR